MSDAPERIWICPEDESWQSGSWDMGPDGQGPEQEYVRADRIEELETDLRQAKISEAFWRDGWHALDQDKRAVEAKLAKAVVLLSRAVDMTGDPHCYYDHHGYCQAHNLEPRGECWVEQSQAFIAELTGGQDE